MHHPAHPLDCLDLVCPRKDLEAKIYTIRFKLPYINPRYFKSLALAMLTLLNDLQDVPRSPRKRSSETLDTANPSHRPSKRQRSIDEDSEDIDWLKQEIDDIRERLIAQVDLKLDEILHELRQWSQI
jgi:small-conductance mechanosensitive channel